MAPSGLRDHSYRVRHLICHSERNWSCAPAQDQWSRRIPISPQGRAKGRRPQTAARRDASTTIVRSQATGQSPLSMTERLLLQIALLRVVVETEAQCQVLPGKLLRQRLKRNRSYDASPGSAVERHVAGSG